LSTDVGGGGCGQDRSGETRASANGLLVAVTQYNLPSSLQDGDDVSLGIGKGISLELVESESFRERGKGDQTSSKTLKASATAVSRNVRS
jgi:hypothetical protein